MRILARKHSRLAPNGMTRGWCANAMDRRARAVHACMFTLCDTPNHIAPCQSSSLRSMSCGKLFPYFIPAPLPIEAMHIVPFTNLSLAASSLHRSFAVFLNFNQLYFNSITFFHRLTSSIFFLILSIINHSHNPSSHFFCCSASYLNSAIRCITPVHPSRWLPSQPPRNPQPILNSNNNNNNNQTLALHYPHSST